MFMQQNMNKSAMQKGLIIGAMVSLKFILGIFGSTALSAIGFLISILVIVVLYLFAKKYRDEENEGFITYGQGFSFIFRTYLYGGIIGSLVIFIYAGLIEPEYLSGMTNEVLKMYDAMNFPVDEDMISMVETIYKPAPFAFLNIFSSAIVGAFWGLILAAFIKKEKSIFEQ
jgi:hypothetical protein